MATKQVIKALFIHHSCGANLLNEGGVKTLLAEREPSLQLWDQGYDRRGIRSLLYYVRTNHQCYGLRDPENQIVPFSIPIPFNNTDPDGFAALFNQPTDPSSHSALSYILQYDIISFKSCYPVTSITSDRQLEQYKTYYRGIRQKACYYFPSKLFMPFTPPPLRMSRTNPGSAARARLFADWIMSEDFIGDSTNIAPFDFFSALSAPPSSEVANTLRIEYCRENRMDSHPNLHANQTIAPIWVDFLIKSARRFFKQEYSQVSS